MKHSVVAVPADHRMPDCNGDRKSVLLSHLKQQQVNRSLLVEHDALCCGGVPLLLKA